MSKKFGDLQSQHAIKLELQIKLLLLYMPCRAMFCESNTEQNRNPQNTPNHTGKSPREKRLRLEELLFPVS